MPDIQIPGIVVNILQVIIAFFAAFAVALWISMIVWTFRDAKARSRDPFAILLATLMTVIFGPLGLLLYFLLRPKVTLAELYERSLEEEALLQDLEERPRCPGCSRVVENEWVFCPDCHTQLKRSCLNCGHGLHLRWNICPYCGTGVHQSGLGAQRAHTRPTDPTPAPIETTPAQETKPVEPIEFLQSSEASPEAEFLSEADEGEFLPEVDSA